jgi:hypothetical protein
MITHPGHDLPRGDGEADVSPPHRPLLVALRQRERNVCEEFVDAHYRGVYRFFLWLTNEGEWAADLTQEPFGYSAA